MLWSFKKRWYDVIKINHQQLRPYVYNENKNLTTLVSILRGEVSFLLINLSALFSRRSTAQMKGGQLPLKREAPQ